MIVIMCDGSSKGNPGPSSCGVIIWRRMKNRTRISRPTKRINKKLGIMTNNQAEWYGVIVAMKYVISQKWQDEEIYIYTDSQLVANQANLKWKIKHPQMKELFNVWEQLIVSNHVKKWHVLWVPRQLIYLADKEAGKA